MKKNPYVGLDNRAYWRLGVADWNALEIPHLWQAKLKLDKTDKVITAGSCFAQHIGRSLARSGYNWYDAEPAPSGVSPETARRFGYGVFSFRTGNIYTANLFNQWITWALSPSSQSDEVWKQDGRYFDPFRPAIEPDGFASESELRLAREATLVAIRTAITEASVVVFTMGLTEGWINAQTGFEYPMAPGTHAGMFDPDRHTFVNYRHSQIDQQMRSAIAAIQSVNPTVQILLTVSPVPLTATASGNHVLVATTYSKSTLRSVAGDLSQDLPAVDYFPSYEIIASPPFRGMFYRPNQRDVSPRGVDHVMSQFFGGLQGDKAKVSRPSKRAEVAAPPAASEEDVECEEAMLEAFAR